MIDSNFFYLSLEQRKMLRKKIFKLLESCGVKLDPHPEMFKNLKNANLTKANLKGTQLQGANLQGVRGIIISDEKDIITE